MKTHTKLRLAKIKVIPLEDRYLLLRPETGAWLILDRNGLAMAQSLSGERELSVAVHEWSGTFPVRSVSRVFDALAEHGLLEGIGPEKTEPEPPLVGPTLAVLHLTRECNFACRYCYADAREHGSEAGSRRIMSSQTAILAVEEMLGLHRDTGKQVTILFHGGEPLLNFEVIRSVVEHPFPQGSVKFEIQTNASLLDAERVGFLKEHNIGVGLSIDGPQSIHDKTRVLSDGSGSYPAVARGIRLLKDAGVPIGVIVVLSRSNWRHVTEIFNELLGLGIRSISFNPLFMAGRGKKNRKLMLSGEELFLAYRELAGKIMEHNRGCENAEDLIEERTLKYMMLKIAQRDDSFMCMRTPCGAGSDTLGVDVNGDIYVCDDFLRQPGFFVGNLRDGPLAQTLGSSSSVRHFAGRTFEAGSQCGACDWRMLCGGICPAHTYYERQAGITESPECEFRRRIILHLFGLLARGKAEPGLFGRRLQPRESREFYFNINYSCNNRCVFCAADLTVPRPDCRELDVSTFEGLLALHRVGKGDSVIVNGGEPTMSGHLPELLGSIANLGAYSHLFTNGRRLSRPDYCRSILASGVSRISIPIYGTSPGAHDPLTGVRGSFDETVAGIDEVCRSRGSRSLPLTLELKLLFFKPTIETNASILSWIAHRFPETDCVSLNGLIVSKVVFESRDALVATRDEMRKAINATLYAAREEGLETLIRIHDIPYCLIDMSNRCFLPPVAHRSDGTVHHYFDPDFLDERPGSAEDTIVPDICKPCVYLEQCSFIRRPYFDERVARQSVDAMFPNEPNVTCSSR